MSMNIKKNKGFTLIELMVAVAVFAVLVVVGIPQINHLTNINRMVSEINLVSGALALARSESVKRGRVITLCATTNPMGTNAICDTTAPIPWEAGWIIFMDVDKDNEFDNGTDLRLKVGAALTAGNTLRLLKSDNAGVLQFQPDGSVRDRGTDGFDDGTFVLCDAARPDDTGTDHEERAKAVNVNRLGRTSKAEDDNDAGTVIDDVDGANITCP